MFGMSLSGCSNLSSLNPISDTVDLTDESRREKSVPSDPGLKTDIEYSLGQFGVSYKKTNSSAEALPTRGVVHTGTKITPSTTLSEFDLESDKVGESGAYSMFFYDWIENNDAIEDKEAYKDSFITRFPTIRFTVLYDNGGFRVMEKVDTESLKANITEIIGAFVNIRHGRNYDVEVGERGEKFIVYQNVVGERLTVNTTNTTVKKGRSGYDGRIRLTPQDYYSDTTGNGIYDTREPITVTVHQEGMSKTVLKQTPTLYEVSSRHNRNGSRSVHYKVLFNDTERFTPFTVESPEGEYLSMRLREWEIFVNDYGDVQASINPGGTGDPDKYTDKISGFGASITEEQLTESGSFIPLIELPPDDRELTEDDTFVATYGPIVEVHEDASYINIIADFEGERYVIKKIQFE